MSSDCCAGTTGYPVDDPRQNVTVADTEREVWSQTKRLTGLVDSVYARFTALSARLVCVARPDDLVEKGGLPYGSLLAPLADTLAAECRRLEALDARIGDLIDRLEV